MLGTSFLDTFSFVDALIHLQLEILRTESLITHIQIFVINLIVHLFFLSYIKFKFELFVFTK